MVGSPMDVLVQFPVRKNKKQKQQFRDAVQEYLNGLGYSSCVEEGSFGTRNLVVGSPESARYLITAHYDTCARMPFPNFITPCSFVCYLLYQLSVTTGMLGLCFVVGYATYLLGADADLAFRLGYLFLWVLLALMILGPANPTNANDNTSGVVTLLEIARSLPENLRDRVCFVLFDLEEAGLVGSSAYRKKHKKATENQLVLNLDCVGDGDHILLFPSKKLKADKQEFSRVFKCCGYFGKKSVLVRDKGFFVYPSDQKNFPCSVGIAAFHKKKNTHYMSRIHTPKDTVLDQTNVNILRAGIISIIAGDAN